MPNSGFISASGVRNSFTPGEVHVAQVVQRAFFHRNRDVRRDAGLVHLEERQAPALPPPVLDITFSSSTLAVK